MYLYRIISGEEWDQTRQDRKVPRCPSDERDNCVHLTKAEDVTMVANQYFTMEEKPVVLEVDVTDFEDKIVWLEPTIEKPWNQPNADIENIGWRNIKRYARFVDLKGTGGNFETGEFQQPVE